jgi:hypothetical protein
MCTTSATITTIRNRVENTLNAEFIPFLAEKAVDFHCRKGIRTWCECSFCNTKRNASAAIGSGYSYLSLGKISPFSQIERETFRTLVENFREQKRKVFRKRLKEAKCSL